MKALPHLQGKKIRAEVLEGAFPIWDEKDLVIFLDTSRCNGIESMSFDKMDHIRQSTVFAQRPSTDKTFLASLHTLTCPSMPMKAHTLNILSGTLTKYCKIRDNSTIESKDVLCQWLNVIFARRDIESTCQKSSTFTKSELLSNICITTPQKELIFHSDTVYRTWHFLSHQEVRTISNLARGRCQCTWIFTWRFNESFIIKTIALLVTFELLKGYIGAMTS